MELVLLAIFYIKSFQILIQLGYKRQKLLHLSIASIWGASTAFKYYNSVAHGRNAATQTPPQVPRFPLDLDAPPGIILESGQPGLVGDKVTQLPGLIQSMAQGEAIPAIGGFKDGNRYIITEGNHRMAAALELYKQTGNPQYVQLLLEQKRWTPFSSGYIDRTYRMTR